MSRPAQTQVPGSGLTLGGMATNKTDVRSDVQKVLVGDMSYDDLVSEGEQAVVREVRDRRIAENILKLNFGTEFSA